MFINPLEILSLIAGEIYGSASSKHLYSVVFAMNTEADRLNEGGTDYVGITPKRLEGNGVEIADLFDRLPVTFTVDEATEPYPIPEWVPLTDMVLICGQDPRRLRHTLKALLTLKPTVRDPAIKDCVAWVVEKSPRYIHKTLQFTDLHREAIKGSPTHTGLFFHEGNLIWQTDDGSQYLIGGKHNENVKIK